MAMRRQSGILTTAPPPQSVRPVYDDFQPKTEKKEEATEYNIQVHLPGFVKERIKITYVNSSHTLRIQGERPREDNRWSRFNQTFPVQENCDVDKIQAKFLGGILTITLPKKIIPRIEPPAEDNTPKPAPTLPKSTTTQPEQIPPPPVSSTSGVEKPLMEEKVVQPRPPSPKSAASEPKLEKGFQDIPPKAASTAINGRQRVVESSQSQSPPKAQKDQDLAHPKAALITDTQKIVESMESGAAQVYKKAIEKKDSLIKGNGKDSVMPETTATKISQTGKEVKETPFGVKKEKPKEDFISEKGMALKNVLGSAKQKVNDLAKRMDEDDKKMLINIGAAVVVLVAIGAYISYSYGSSHSGKSEN